MIKKLIVSFCLLFTLGILAQQGSSSPYSYYGIGEVKSKGTVDTRSMGGVTVIPDSIHLNLQNPASYSNLRMATFSIGGTYNTTHLNTNTQEEKARRTTLDYLALGLPMGKLGAAFGLMPYSSVGYKIQNVDQTNYYTGKGGINRGFVGFSYKITPKLSVGLDANYYFGQIITENNSGLSTVQYGTRELNTSNINGFNANFGLMYATKLKNKLNVFGSVLFTPESNLSATNTRSIATIRFSALGSAIVVDEGQPTVLADTNIKLPSKIAIGAGFGENKKWLIGAEYTMTKTNGFENRFADIAKGSFENANRIAVGGYFIPKYNSFTSYLERVTYRGGFRYENTGLVIGNKSVNDMAFTFGIGMPAGGRFSNINFGVEYGKRGTKAANLVEENYLNFSLSLSLSDRWFVKRKYD